MSYGSAAVVRSMTGIKPDDLGFDDANELTAWLNSRLVEIKVLIDRDRNRSDWEAQGWLPAIDSIANRWAAEHVRFAMASRDSPIVRVDDFRVMVPNDNVPGKGVMRDLRRFPKKANKRFALEMSVAKARRRG